MIAQLRIAALLVAVLAALSVSAHEQNVSVTRVQFNDRTGNLEVMHRFSIHDVEHAGRRLFNEPTNLLVSATDRQRFAEYVHDKFYVADENGVKLTMKPVGHEIEGRYLWVYAEAKISEGVSKLSLYQGALLEVWPTQSNLVNVSVGDKAKSATFVRGSSPANFTF